MTDNDAHEKRLIDANHIVEVAEHASHEWNLAMAAADGQRQINQVYKMQELCKAVKAVADAAPTVDAVEVVRCKDCSHRGDPDKCHMRHLIWKPDEGYIYVDFTMDDYFCSSGKRKNK